MSLKQLPQAIDAVRPLIENDQALARALDASRALAKIEGPPATLAKRISTTRIADGAATDGPSSAETADALRRLAEALSGLGAMKTAAKTAGLLSDALRGRGETPVAALAEQIARAGREQAEAKQAQAAERARKAREAADRVAWYAAKFRKTEPEREALLAVYAEIDGLGRNFGAADWKALAKELSNQSGGTKTEAQRYVRGWIATVTRHRDSIRSVERARAEGY